MRFSFFSKVAVVYQVVKFPGHLFFSSVKWFYKCFCLDEFIETNNLQYITFATISKYSNYKIQKCSPGTLVLEYYKIVYSPETDFQKENQPFFWFLSTAVFLFLIEVKKRISFTQNETNFVLFIVFYQFIFHCRLKLPYY